MSAWAEIKKCRGYKTKASMIALLDYGSGNLRSAQKALLNVEANGVATSTPHAVCCG